MTKKVLSTLLLFVASLLFSSVATAQTNQGVIAGNVVDSSGAAIPNVSITATGVDTGVVYKTTTTSAGAYRFPSIQIGRYNITTNAPGFKESVNTGVEVRVGTTTSRDLSLSAGGANETVTVDSNAPQVETETSEVGGTVSAREIIELPLALGGVGAMRSAGILRLPHSRNGRPPVPVTAITASSSRRSAAARTLAMKSCLTAPARHAPKTVPRSMRLRSL